MSTILIIDDNESLRASLVEILTLELHTTLEAENGQIGLRIIRQATPDLIVCDMDMPVTNGFEVLRTAKADPIYAGIPFVMLTGHRDERALKASRDLGVEAYLAKPIAVTEFLSTISHFLKDKDPALLL